jgi:hypothetical protein
MALDATQIRRLVKVGVTIEQMLVMVEIIDESNGKVTGSTEQTERKTPLRKPLTNAERARIFRQKHKGKLRSESVTVVTEIVTPSPTPPLILTSLPVVSKGFEEKKVRNARDVEEWFPRLWAAYPKRKGTNSRKAALAKFVTVISNGANGEEVTNGALRYARHCDEQRITGTPYVQQTTRWLNEEGWKDGLASDHKSNSSGAGVDRVLKEFRNRYEGSENGAFGPDEPNSSLGRDGFGFDFGEHEEDKELKNITPASRVGS